jgi:hypothetical protein
MRHVFSFREGIPSSSCTKRDEIAEISRLYL